jgi:hypothetical protein
MIEKKSQQNLDLPQRGLTLGQWKTLLENIGRQANLKVRTKTLGEFTPEEKDQAREIFRQINVLWREAQSRAGVFDRKPGEKPNKQELLNRVVPVGGGGFSSLEIGPGSGAGYPAGRGRGDRGRGRGGRDGREYQGIQWGTTPPVSEIINLDDSFYWSGVEPNPLGTISLNDFSRTGGRVLAEELFGGMSVPKKEVDQKIFNYLRNKGLYRNAQLRWDSNSDSSVLFVAVMSPQPGRPPTWSSYSFEQAVNASRVGQTYDELYDELSRGNSFDLFRKFAISLKREISRVIRQMNEYGAPAPLKKAARFYGAKWVRVLNAKIRDLA